VAEINGRLDRFAERDVSEACAAASRAGVARVSRRKSRGTDPEYIEFLAIFR
jgi:hypothetical protein